MAITDNLVVYWPLEESTGTRLDLQGSNDLTDVDSVGVAAGKVGLAADFTTGYLTASNSSDLQLGGTDFTISLWAKFVTFGSFSTTLVSKRDTGNTAYEWWIDARDGSPDYLRFIVFSGGTPYIVGAQGSTDATTGVWYHIVARWNNTTKLQELIINDGTPVTATRTGVTINNNTDPVWLGQAQHGGSITKHNGRTDEVAIWKRVLTDEEVTWLYNSGYGNPLGLRDYHAIDGIWSWFTNPRAVHYNSKLYWGAVTQSSAGDLVAHDYNRLTGTIETSTLSTAFDGNDHANPSILIRDSDKKLMVFATRHNDTEFNYWVSTNAEDASAFGTATNIDSSIGGERYDYPCPIQLTGEANDPIYVFYRHRNTANTAWLGTCFTKSTDDGATWAAGTTLFQNAGERPYFMYARNGDDRIDFACTNGHPDEVAACSIYHFYYQGGNYYTSDGTLIGDGTALPLEPADVTLVYDGTTVDSWVYDLAVDSSGNPVIVYSTLNTRASDHRYRYARWSGSTWVDNEICTAGGPLYVAASTYSGGVTVDKVNTNIVWCSRNTAAGVWGIYRYTTSDGGATWVEEQQDAHSGVVNARPFCPWGASYPAIWWSGTYTTYSNYDTFTRLRTIPMGLQRLGGKLATMLLGGKL